MTASLAIPRGLDDLHPADVLRWANDQFGLANLVVTASFEDAVLVHVAATAVPGIDIVLLDTQYLFAETEWFAEELRTRLDLNLRVVHPLAEVQPDNLWQTDIEACCHVRKVEPLARAIAGKQAWVTGVRRADGPTRANAPVAVYDIGRGLVKINPLATYSDDDMALYTQLHDLPIHPLIDKGYASIGCWPCTRPVAPGEDKRAGRWAGAAKTECGLHG
ncbi:MAG: phosphoadenylyl-sulfate reductase [Actinomycetota bacterium]|nr:phosphoadenylyl-sulfate reductase [Actinomycetota bacterium]